MKIVVASLLLVSIFVASCSESREDKIMGTWYGDKFQNDKMDNFFKESKNYIDTIGSNGNAATNVELYGSANIDSIRKVLQAQYDSTLEVLNQANPVKNTVFTFRKDGLLVINFDGRTDTNKWHFSTDSLLDMEEITGKEKGSKTQVEVLTLTSKELQLKIQEEGTFNIVTFSRDKK